MSRRRARRVVITAPCFDTELFSDGYLNMIYIVSIPDRLEDAVAEPKDQNVLDRFLAEIMVDAVDLAFFEYL